MNKYWLFLSAFALAATANAQQKVLTAKDYEHAESFMAYNTAKYIDNGSVSPNWLEGDKFWFTLKNATGTQTFLVDPEKKTKTITTDYGSGASATTSPNRRRNSGSEVLSPDGKKAILIKDYNLYVKDVASGKLTQLTTDGIKDYGYATDNAGWKHSDAPILRWSPDSKKLTTFQQDQRNSKDMYLVTTNVGAPKLEAWKYPLPGDKSIATIRRVIIEVENPKVIAINVAPDQHRGTLSDDISSSGTFDDIDWKADGSEVAFVSTSRDHKNEKFRIANAQTGAVREVFEETVKTQFESGQGTINWRYLPASKEIIWFSERDNWGHLYLYDATTGKVKNQITKGNWAVTRLIKVDEKTRTIYFMANGQDKLNPYFGHFYKIGFDGKKLTDLTPEPGNHMVSFSPSEKYFIDNYSQPNVPAVVALRDINGKLITELAKTDVSRLSATGWKAPTPVSVKASDGKTDIYGLIFTPNKMEAGKKYPVIDYIYPGPQGGSMGSWFFSASRGDHQALAELGFIVIVIEGTSNPGRSKSYHDMNYGNMAENTLPDQISAIKQLSEKYPIDTTKVGIWGHSGGGFATAAAMFRYPDFFKVGISESGNHDNRNYEDDWGERYNGLAENVDYEAQANQTYAKNLKGKLMLVHGMMDDNVPPYNTLLVVEALQKANKSFDLVIFPNSAHGYGAYSPYMMRRRWDYFVQHLLGAEPPKDYKMQGTVIR
ncbi:MAG: DPP IV N-terminal domain-containing protein [Pedobacter agri]